MDLFNTATLVDFVVARCDNTAEVLMKLGDDDQCEVGLRRIAAYTHERRTGDRDAAYSVLAIKPAGGNFDLAPEWLVFQSSVYSQSEFKRRERARNQTGPIPKANAASGEAKGAPGRGKGKDGGKGRGKGAGAPKGKPKTQG